MKEISKENRELLYSEFDYLEDAGILDSETKQKMKDAYKEKERMSFLNIVLVIGIVLIAIGIASFVSVNWKYISDYGKIALLVAVFFSTSIVAARFESKNKRLSDVLYYISVIEFGASVFLIADILNVYYMNYGFKISVLIWITGVLPLVILKKDKFMNLIFSGIAILYIVSEDFRTGMIWLCIGLLIMLITYLILRSMEYEGLTFCGFNAALAFYLVEITSFVIRTMFEESTTTYGIVTAATVVPVFILGIFITRLNIKSELVRFEGHIMHGIAAVIISTSLASSYYIYTQVVVNKTGLLLSIIFSAAYIAYLMYLTHKGNIVSIVFTGVMIITLYSNISSAFFPTLKPLLFIVSGVVIVMTYIYTNKKRKLVSKNEMGK